MGILVQSGEYRGERGEGRGERGVGRGEWGGVRGKGGEGRGDDVGTRRALSAGGRGLVISVFARFPDNARVVPTLTQLQSFCNSLYHAM